MTRRLLLAVVVLVLTVAALACSGASPAEPKPSPTSTPAVASAGPREVQAGAPIGDPTSGPPAHEAKVVYVGPNDRPAVALTFDTGVDAGHMPEVLDILKKHGVLGTFGITGEWAVTNPALLKRIAADGHAIVNHSWSHSSFTGEDTETPPLSEEQIRDELKRTEEKIQQIAGVTTKPYFRPPYGDYDSRVDKIAFDEGYEYNVLWFVDGLGWEGRSTGYAINVTLKNAFNGAIYLYHTDNPTEYKALEEIIDGLEERGFQMLTIPQLLGQGAMPTPRPSPEPSPVLPAVLAPPPQPPAPVPPPIPAPVPVPTPTPAPPAYVTLAYDDFESAAPDGGFGWEGPWSTLAFAVGEGEAHSGSRYLDMALARRAVRLAVPASQTEARLRLWARFSSLESGDSASAQLSIDGSVWTAYALFSEVVDDNAWHLFDIAVPLPVTAERIFVRFQAQMDPQDDVWYIDDVELVRAPP